MDIRCRRMERIRLFHSCQFACHRHASSSECRQRSRVCGDVGAVAQVILILLVLLVSIVSIQYYYIFRVYPPLCDETKILTFTDTETFYPRPIFPIPIPRLFSDTKFSDTDTETFFRDQFFYTDTKTLKKLSWVSRLRPRLLNMIDNF